MFGADANELKMTVVEGDSVTLHTNLTDMKGVIKVLWRVGEKDSQDILVGEAGNDDYKDNTTFSDRLQVDVQTRDITIKNMRSKHTGRYEVEIISNIGSNYKAFRVTVTGEHTFIFYLIKMLCSLLIFYKLNRIIILLFIIQINYFSVMNFPLVIILIITLLKF